MRAKDFTNESAVEELKDKLPKLKRTDYDTIDELMQKISRRYKMTGDKLHDLFVHKYGHTPDAWIKKIKKRLAEKKIVEFLAPSSYDDDDDDDENDPLWKIYLYAAFRILKINQVYDEKTQLNLMSSIIAPQLKAMGETYDLEYAKAALHYATVHILKKLARTWWLGNEQQMIQVENTIDKMGWEIGQDEGYDEGGVFVVKSGDMNGKTYMSWPHSDLQQGKQEFDESLDKPYKMKWEKSEYGSYDALAKLPDGTYLAIMFNQEVDRDDPNNVEWVVEFYRDNTQEVTGQGDQQRIFATVLEAIRKFVKKVKPKSISFSAAKNEEPGTKVYSRANLYNKLVQRYAGTMGYQVRSEDLGDIVFFTLVRSDKNLDEGEVVQFPGRQQPTNNIPKDVLQYALDWYWADFDMGSLEALKDPKGYGSGVSNELKFIQAKLQTKGYKIDFDDEFENLVLTNNQGQQTLLPILQAQDREGWAKGLNEQGVAEGLDRLYPFDRTVIDYMQDNSWLSAERAYFRAMGLEKKKQMNPNRWAEIIQRYIDLYNKHKGNQGVSESLTAGRNLSPATEKYIKNHKWKLTTVNPMNLDIDSFDDPFNRVIDIDTEHSVNFKEPIIVHSNGTTIIDGFHRVYQAQKQGLKKIPAYVPVEQDVTEGIDFDTCFDKACKLYDKAEHKNLEPKLVQVADFKGDGSGADKRWNKLPQHVWQHYVVIVGDKVLDPTARQFGADMPTKYNVSDLDKLWNKQYVIRPREGVAESESTKSGIVQTEVYGTKAYHAKCMEPNCDWQSKRYDKIKQAQMAAQKHAKKHIVDEGEVIPFPKGKKKDGEVIKFPNTQVKKPSLSPLQKKKALTNKDATPIDKPPNPDIVQEYIDFINEVGSIALETIKPKYVKEDVTDNNDMKILNHFIKWSIEKLHVEKPPEFHFSKDTQKAKEGHHTGVHTDNNIWVYIGNRNLIDICRTIFHELVHQRQDELNMIKNGDSYPGSPIEAMADMMAGKYIKIYGKEHPEIFQ